MQAFITRQKFVDDEIIYLFTSKEQWKIFNKYLSITDLDKKFDLLYKNKDKFNISQNNSVFENDFQEQGIGLYFNDSNVKTFYTTQALLSFMNTNNLCMTKQIDIVSKDDWD